MAPAALTIPVAAGTRPPLCARAACRTLAPLALADGQVFEAVFNPTEAVALFTVIALPFGYWWFITVPEARIKLAKDKRLDGGESKAYIEELAGSAEPRAAERWFFAKWLRQARPSKKSKAPAEPDRMRQAVASGVPTAGLEGPAAAQVAAPPPTRVAPAPSLGELFRPASLRANATPRFWSGDNPIVVTMGVLLGLGVFAAAARENGALALDGAVLAAGLAFGISRLGLD